MPHRDLNLAEQPAAFCVEDVDGRPSHHSLLSVPKPLVQRDYFLQTPRSSESTPKNLQVAKLPSTPNNGFQVILDQQRIALLDALTVQHSTLVQVVERQYQTFRTTSEFQSKRTTERSINGDVSSTAERSLGLLGSSSVQASSCTVEEDHQSGFAFPSGTQTTLGRSVELDSSTESIQQGERHHLRKVSMTTSCISELPSIEEADNTDDGSPKRTQSVQFSFAARSKSSVVAIISYLRSSATSKQHSSKSPVKKKLGDLRRQATDLHIEDTLSSRKQQKETIRTPRLDMFIAVIICLNGISMALNVEWSGYKASQTIGLNQDDDAWPHAETIFAILQHAFTITFALEMGVRLYYQSYRYFYEKANLFDAFLVLSAIIDTYILPLLETNTKGGNLTLLRFVRMFKLARVMRAIRMLHFCSSLRVLVRTIVTGCYSLVWSVVLLGIVICVGGIVVSQLTESVITDEAVPFERRKWIYHYYGTSLRSMYTLFEVTLSGCWPNYARRLIHEVNGWWALFWIIYILLVVFAILRIISAIFLKDTLDNAKLDAEMMIAEKMKTKESYLQKLRNAFEAIDTQGKGVVTRTEFDFVLQHPKVSAYLAVLDLEVHESSLLFNLLDEEGIGCITYDEFLDGVMKLKGQARALDVIAIQQDFKGLWKGLNYLRDNFERIYGPLEKTDPSAASVRKLFQRKTDSRLSVLGGLSPGFIRGASNGSMLHASNGSILPTSPPISPPMSMSMPPISSP